MKTLLRLALALACTAALAQDLAPDVLIRSMTDDVLSAIRHDETLRADKPAKLAALVEAKILPHSDFRRAAQTAVGPAWQRASAEQRDRLTAEFRTLLVRTYSQVLAAYSNVAIAVLPVHVAAGAGDVTVHCTVRVSGRAPLAIDYAMERDGGEWKIYDVSVDGMSLVMNYRSTFSAEIERNEIDGLIAALAKKNRSVTPGL